MELTFIKSYFISYKNLQEGVLMTHLQILSANVILLTHEVDTGSALVSDFGVTELDTRLPGLIFDMCWSSEEPIARVA